MLLELRTKIKIAVTANVSQWKHHRTVPIRRRALPAAGVQSRVDCMVAVGASTGGTQAVRQILEALPAETPGIVVVQHMPAGFTRMYAERLNGLCAMEVKEAEDGDRILPGRVIIAAGGHQLGVSRRGGRLYVTVGPDEPVGGHCPSVDVLFRSVATAVGERAVGVILTGMGRDGADAMKVLHDTGAQCFGQDEATSIVFGMPKEARDCGAVDKLVPLNRMARAILQALSNITPESGGLDR